MRRNPKFEEKAQIRRCEESRRKKDQRASRRVGREKRGGRVEKKTAMGTVTR